MLVSWDGVFFIDWGREIRYLEFCLSCSPYIE